MIIAEYAEELLPSRNSDLLDQVRDVVSVPLAEAFGEVLDVLADALLRLAERAGATQNDYFEAIQLLRQQREPIAARFRGHLAQAWQALEAGRPLSVERTLTCARGDLSLVSAQELDVRLAVRNLAGAIQHRWRPELMRLSRFLGFIAVGPRIDADTNPFGPEHVGAAVHAALHGLVLAPQVQLAIVRICEQELQERVGELYARLEQRLDQVARARSLPTARTRRRAIPRNGASGEDAAPDWISRFFETWHAAAPLSAAPRARWTRMRAPVALAAAVAPEAPPAEPEPALPEPAQASDFDHRTAEYFRTLAMGTWLDFVDREGRVQPGKLSWVSPISSRLMFVNRRGGRLCVASPEALAMMVQLDRLRLHRDDDAFYSAMQGAVNRLQRVAVAA
ncbi:DUF1631 family protein [Xanthomonas translucens]|uniref:DUF1631 family protein n=13 Tax=Xanthomonas campestris pv. translucens TaxID=343 RepID=UPI0009B9A5C8|nr:DUF1631 family protein [Xanthomonas translucens]MCT8272407.1 DUF1631 domain-containing protein [Xanthomonas translucens pv. undulosa]MCT8283660.1 DUF1631 domain-containing protein [Xanthomonas translucens pv. undulosa]MCT8318414.1 DUF1631 domain-containing protein [Xanthomonas translucens pv. undulosa]QEN94446.1 DUF1631 domain-containing protein [Xanthomonas translucens pv. undulosa]QEO27285.1 DUF1631 domain-containing protein [Xanthomonas translucens pv. undulosa]